VVVRDDGSGKRLVAYLIAQNPALPLPASQIRSRLAGRLPEYMVPSAYVWLDRFPLTPNTKIDKRALPAPDQGLSWTAFSS
jgi:non-ribosomal peptide synthetase component E (peptide arylation enzyme)